MEELEFRLATPADKAQVLVCHGGEVGSIYNGVDYLPARYDISMASWNKVCGLCYHRSAGIVIGYGQIFVFDNKRHMLLTALRVHQQYQGRGIATHLRNFLCREARKKFPDVTPEVRFGTHKMEFTDPDFYTRNPDYSFISKRHYYTLEFPLSQFSKLQSAIASAATAAAPESQSPQWTDRRGVFTAMLADSTFRQMYSNVSMSINFELIELMEENLDILPGGNDNAPSVLVAKGEELTLGFGCLIYCTRGLRIDIDLFNNAIDKTEFSSDALSITCACLVLQFVHRVLISQSHSLSQMPTKALSLFVSLDCYNRGELSCPKCDLEERLADRIRRLIMNDEIAVRQPFFQEVCPYPMVTRKMPF